MLMQQGASPHGYSLRPSEAQALQESDLVVWIGEDLTPWLENAVDNLAANAHSLELLHLDGTLTYEFREDAVFGGHDEHDDHDDHKGHDDHDDHDKHDDHAHDDHGHGEEKHDDHHDKHADHDEHDEHGHDDHKEASESGHDHHDHHDHDGEDPHAWLSPANAVIWLDAIAAELSELDPANAEIYAMNAKMGATEIEAAADEIKHKLEPFHDTPFVVFHDAFQYFEKSFDLKAAGALHLGDASTPSAGRISEIQEEIKEQGISCVFAEPQYNSALVASVAPAGTNTGILDPLGINLTAGPTLYTALLNDLADNAVACFQ